MRSYKRYTLALSAIALLAACDREGDSAAMSVELRRDLELAQATGVELAARNAPILDVGIEPATPGTTAPAAKAALPTPRRQSPPARAPRSQPAPVPAEAPMTGESTEATAPVESPFAIGTGAAETPAPVSGGAPDVAGGPVMVPTAGGAGDARDPGGWGNGPTGVVIRGGSIGDDDHCQYHWPMGGRRQPPRSSGPVYTTPDFGRPSPVVSTGGRTRSAPTIRSRGPSGGGASPIGSVTAPSAPSSGGRSRTGG